MVVAALEAIAQQNKSAVNTVANAKDVLGELTVRYVAPPPAALQNLANYNHDKIVNFVGTGECGWGCLCGGGSEYRLHVLHSLFLVCVCVCFGVQLGRMCCTMAPSITAMGSRAPGCSITPAVSDRAVRAFEMLEP